MIRDFLGFHHGVMAAAQQEAEIRFAIIRVWHKEPLGGCGGGTLGNPGRS